MPDKKNFVLRIDDDVYKLLEKWASDEFRSVNGQIEWLIDKALKEAGRKKENGEKPAAKGKKG
ncbi:MAG: Arc family DNA binding domain-containing protein [Filimonas sp.]|nr:Arc family DNA binding domain-containing protein [Filimonas sp.]